MKRLVLFVALIALISVAATEPPYGCYKQLRWGMTPEAARKIMAATETKTATRGEDSELVYSSFFNLSNRKLDVILSFKAGKLFKVQIDFPADDPRSQSCLPGASDRVAAFKILKATVDAKYGKAKTEVEANQGTSLTYENAICQQKGKSQAVWETAYSRITLTAELLMVKDGKPLFAPLLVYLDKTQLK